MRLPYGARKLIFSSIILGLGLAGEAAAQDTTSAIRGKLIDDSGNPLINATIVVEDERNGRTRTLQSNSTGTFFANNLAVGGPYTVTINSTKTITINSIGLGDVYNLSVDMAAPTAIEEIVVFGNSNNFVDVAAGPSASFGEFELNTSVAFDRDIKDVYTMDPRFNLDGAQVNCIGKHPRFNSISLDGVSQNDRFGLNTNGYSTATGMPFPYEGIAQVSAELAPFDVTYGGFSACNINAVTKSGGNEWTGTAFYEFTGDSWRGDSLTVGGVSQDFETIDYEEEKYGFSVGGPLIRDKLFIFAAFEDTEEPEFIAQGYAGSSNGTVRPWLSEGDFSRISDIANNVYNYDPGGQSVDGAQTETKYMVRLDWSINDYHSASLIYNYYDGMEDRASDSDSNEYEFANHFYQKGAESETYTAKLLSQWTDAFSTEIFYSNNTMDDSQVTTGPKGFGDMQISLDDNVVYLGADDSRQANALNTESEFFKFSGQYLAGDHVLTAGYEREALDVFNQFVQHSRGGEYDYFDDSVGDPDFCTALTAQGRFDDPNCGMSGIDKFELGRPSRIYYGSGGGTNNAADAAASLQNNLNTIYLQDEWYIPNLNLTLVGGLRYDWFESDDRPVHNQAFQDLYGFANTGNIDGIDLLMPRFGATWEANYNLTLRAGAGLYSGGNPNVWLTNAWSNDGITNVQLRKNNFSGAESVLNDIPLSGQQRPGYDVPQELVDGVTNTTPEDANDSNIALIDPGFEQPSEWKFALGGTYTFDNGLTADFDYIYSIAKDSAYYVDLSQGQIGTTSAGQPIFDYVAGEDNFMLTNSGNDASSKAVSLVLSHSYDNGLDWMLGYAYTDARDISPMTSFTAGSNFDNLSLFEITDPRQAVSNYVVPHRFTARVSWGHDFIVGHETRVTAMFYRAEGQPASHVMSSSDLEGNGRFGRHLLYVPTANDPNVVYEDDFDQAAFSAFIDSQGYNSGFVDRNGTHADWTSKLDLRIDQELPMFFGTKARAYMKIYNLLNLIDDDMGLQYDAQFFSQEVVSMSVNPQGQYVFERFRDRDITDLQETRSLWEIRMGIQFEF